MVSRHPTTSWEAAISAPEYRIRWWWVPATILAVAAVSAAQVAAALTWFGLEPLRDESNLLAPFLLAHIFAAAASIALFGTIRAVRGNIRSSLGYSERYLIGLGYGIVTSLLISIAAASLIADAPGRAIEYAGVLMSVSLVSLEMPVACVVGGLTWHLLARVRGGVPVPRRRAFDVADLGDVEMDSHGQPR